MKDAKTPLGVVLTARLSGAYRQVRAAVELPFAKLSTGTRANIARLHTEMLGVGGFTDGRVVQAVVDYSAVNYVYDSLMRGEGKLMQAEEVQLIHRVISKYCYLASNVAARSRLPKETEKKMGDEVTVFARIHAGIFALARGDQAAAGNYLSAAKGCYWNIDAEKLGGFVAAGKFADAAGLLGDCFSRLKTLLPASDLPAPAVVRRQQEREKTASWNLAADPLLRLRHEQLLELTAKTEPAEIKPTEACPKPLAPQNTPGPQSPRKK
jgi:hypothetical protein